MNKAIIKDAVVKLRLNPSIKSEVSDEAFHGSILTVEGEMSDGWLKVKTEYDYFGYLLEESVITEFDVVSKWSGVRKIVSQTFADVLVNPKVQSQIIDTLPMGAFVLAEGEGNNGFIKAELVNGEKGWIREAFISTYEKKTVFEESNELRNKIVDTAIKFLGAQYRWGGKTQIGIDCSGLCFMAYFLNGINIYRDAKIVDGFPVRKLGNDNIKRGDLLFFPDHIGMYLENDMFIHSSFSENGVTINSIKPGHSRYREDLADVFLGAGSVFNLN